MGLNPVNSCIILLINFSKIEKSWPELIEIHYIIVSCNVLSIKNRINSNSGVNVDRYSKTSSIK